MNDSENIEKTSPTEADDAFDAGTVPTDGTLDMNDAPDADAPDIADSDFNSDDSAIDSIAGELRLPSPKTARLTYSAYAEMRPSPESKYAPMGLFGYIIMLLLSMIPIVGFVASAIIACVSKKLARRRFALAVVILDAALTVAAAVTLTVLIFVFHVDVADAIFSLFR